MKKAQKQQARYDKGSFKHRGLIITIFYILFLNIGCQPADRLGDLQEFSRDKMSIVGGNDVSAEDPIAKSIVAFYLKSANSNVQNYCTGTIIADAVILTAAHCFVDVADSLGESIENVQLQSLVSFDEKIMKNINEFQKPFAEISKVVIHPQYRLGAVKTANKEAMWDAAVVFLNEKIPHEKAKVALVEDKNILKKGLRLTAAGFGLLKALPKVFAQHLMKVDIQVDESQLTISQFTYVNQNQQGTCNGDSGGPAYLKLNNGSYGVIGVTSWGDRFCQMMGAFTSVPAISEWIKETMLKN